ncbi:F-box domain-containing protein [Stagonosporopsis vannaccii]|nr:F-box domain-containing protein [Stagonosporopsis vannaccii]
MLQLPNELILHIIACTSSAVPQTDTPAPDLEPPELVNLQHVSRRFLSLSRDNKLWKQLCFAHSYTERRRRRLEITFPAPPATADPRLAELIEAASNLADSFDITVHNPRAPGAEAQVNRNREKRRAALLANWDPSAVGEEVNWYQEFVQRHAPVRVGWFEGAGSGGDDEEQQDEQHGGRREATGAGILYDSHGLADKLVAPLDDGSIAIWDAAAQSSRLGRRLATSEPGLLSNCGPELDRATRLAQSHAIMTETGAVHCVSIDSARQRAFFAVQNTLNDVDLHTLQLVSRTPFPFPVTALSEALPDVPLTVGTNWTLHLHDTRKPPSIAPLTTPAFPSASTSPSFSRLATGDFAGHVSLSQPGALSIVHTPDTLNTGNGNIWVSGRFTSLLNYDRRFFPRLRGTLHSGARISSLSLLPTPYIPSSLRLGAPYSPASSLLAARSTGGMTLLAAGEYKGKGSLELYSLSPEPGQGVNSCDARTTQNPRAVYQNRQTAGAAKLLSACAQGTRVVLSDGDGVIKWVERDGRTPVREENVNALTVSETAVSGRGAVTPTPSARRARAFPATSPSAAGDMVQHMLSTQSLSPASPSPSPGPPDLILRTGEGKLALLGYGRDELFSLDTFSDALEHQVDGDGVDTRALEREYGLEMRRALEQQAREVRWLRGYGL